MTPYENHLHRLATANDRILVLTAENRAAIRSLPGVLGNRFIDVGICEQTLLGVAAGLAQRGRRPVVHALAAFLTMRGFEFIRTDVGIAQLPVVLIGGVAGLLSDGNGPTHQAIEDIALMRGIPGMAVIAPAGSSELNAALTAALDYAGPCYIRYYDGPDVAGTADDYQLGRSQIIGNPHAPLVIATYGMLVSQALVAQRHLAAQGYEACILNVRSIAPLDETTLLRVAGEARLLIVLEDHLQVGGLFSAVAELLATSRTSAALLPINLGRHWFGAGLLADVLEQTGMSGERIAASVIAHLRKDEDGKSVPRGVRVPPNREVQFDLG